jgi:hypothetical protein
VFVCWCMSHVTRHTSHVTHHTSHATHHTSHITSSQLFLCHSADVIALNKISGAVRVSFIDQSTAKSSSAYSHEHFFCSRSYDTQRKIFAPFSEDYVPGRGSKSREAEVSPFSFEQDDLDKLIENGGEVSSLRKGVYGFNSRSVTCWLLDNVGVELGRALVACPCA